MNRRTTPLNDCALHQTAIQQRITDCRKAIRAGRVSAGQSDAWCARMARRWVALGWIPEWDQP